ncbi:MAG: PspC domain-containing protein [Actinobacteria bacterium]|nr:PspC domain-containing protein [Actinomycetota bacterium]
MSIATAPPRATRPTRGRMVAGVARGLADHLHLPVWLVRVAFVVMALAGGMGIVMYAAFWAVLPLAPDAAGDATSEADVARARSSDFTRLLALAGVVIGVALLLAAMGVSAIGGAVVPIVIALVGAALVWQQADDDQRSTWSATAARAARETAGTTAQAGRWRIVVGIGLVVLGLIGLLVSRTGPAAAVQALATALLLLAGIGLVVFPWAYRRWREQQDQRRALIRSEERAEIAAHVHDSVLQTLTLIQRNAADPREVARLARTEERALRSWLYAPEGDPSRTFAARLLRDAAEVEAAYSATLDVVTVGDGTIDATLGALLAATREAMVNAARHGGGIASVYAEVDDTSAEVFVRDRGPGFDPTAVPADRHGLRDSVIGRMERNGGTVVVASTVGSGTEIRLRIARPMEGGA